MSRLATGVALIPTLALLAALAGCGGQSSQSDASIHTRSSDTANIAATLNEPRSGDPTAGRTSSTTSTAGTSVPLNGKQKPAPSGSGNAPATPPASPGDAEKAPAAAPAWESGGEATDDPRKIGARHVLIQWMGSERAGKSVLRTKEQALVLAQEVLRRAKAGEDVGRLANEYSDEPNAGARGGSLGRFTRGQMVAGFDAVAFKLKVGEVSGIVETPFGYHIIQRTE